MVSESLVPHSPLLSTLLLMDNDISTVADGALDLVEDLKQLDLTGNIQGDKFDWDDLIWFFLGNLAISNLLDIKHTSIVLIAFKRSHHIVSSLNWWPTREWASKLVVAFEHSRVLAIFCSKVFTSDHPCTMCTMYTLKTWVIWSENHATKSSEHSRVLECHL